MIEWTKDKKITLAASGVLVSGGAVTASVLGAMHFVKEMAKYPELLRYVITRNISYHEFFQYFGNAKKLVNNVDLSLYWTGNNSGAALNAINSRIEDYINSLPKNQRTPGMKEFMDVCATRHSVKVGIGLCIASAVIFGIVGLLCLAYAIKGIVDVVKEFLPSRRIQDVNPVSLPNTDPLGDHQL